MKVALISFTRAGAELCGNIAQELKLEGHECIATGKEEYAESAGILPLTVSLNQWAEDMFPSQDALIFVSACGIAVRAIAPFVKDKSTDPAVLVIDEIGQYAISLLSGHLGGANQLTRWIADKIGAAPVITTATDLNQRFAVDEWAKENHLQLGNMKFAKEISAAVLRGDPIGAASDFPIKGQLPEQLESFAEDENLGTRPNIGFKISVFQGDGPFNKTLALIPKTITVGIGCRKGISPEVVEEQFFHVLTEHRINLKSVEKICSIDLKKEEEALHRLAEKLAIPLQFFSSQELEKVRGEFTSSDFVNQITGVDNVCERAAVLGSQGQLIIKKQAQNGVTIAMALRKEEYRWKQE